MELIYLWVDEYRTFNNMGINISNRFNEEKYL